MSLVDGRRRKRPRVERENNSIDVLLMRTPGGDGARFFSWASVGSQPAAVRSLRILETRPPCGRPVAATRHNQSTRWGPIHNRTTVDNDRQGSRGSLFYGSRAAKPRSPAGSFFVFAA